VRRYFATTFAALTLAFGATACQSTAASSQAPQKLVGAQGTTTAEPPPTSSAAPETPVATSSSTAKPVVPTSTAAARPTTSHPVAPSQHPTTAPPIRPSTTAHPVPPPTSAAGCMHHTVGRCGAGEPHPPGTMALCLDGTYSMSTTPQGTCSHHGGVDVWYY
jgi:hypothetical protein